jgi:hypothetical protein
MKSWVDIAIAGHATERHRLGDGTTTLGSSPEADIVLRTVEGLMPEHFSLRPQPEGCWVELVESAPEPFTFDGRPSRGCLVPWGQELFHGGLRLSVQAESPSESGKRSSPILWVAALVIPVAALSMLYKPGAHADLDDASTLNPPALFGPAPACAEQGAGALGRASIAEQIAFAKNQRGVFDLRDAVDAVQLMREASQCYAMGERAGKADAAAATADEWTRKLSFNYQRVLLELELARRQGSIPGTLKATSRLKRMLAYAGPAAEDYMKWLDQQTRGTISKHAAKKAEKKKKK